jgi:hypothetical protein
MEYIRRTFLTGAGTLAASVVGANAALAQERSDMKLSHGDNSAEKPAPIITGVSQAEGIAKFAIRASYRPAYETLAEIEATQIPAGVQSITCLAYATPGDLFHNAMHFMRVSSGSSGMPCVRSADTYLPNGSTNSTNGGYWILTNNIVMPEMFGALRNGTNDDSGAIQAAINYMESVSFTVSGGGSSEVTPIACEFSPGTYACNTGLVSHKTARYFVPAASDSADLGAPVCWIKFPSAFAGPYGWHFVNSGGGPCTIENITLLYKTGTIAGIGSGPTPSPIHGWLIERTVRMKCCVATGWPGNGFHIDGASAGSGFSGVVGFADSCDFWACASVNNGFNGFYGYGADFNVCTFYMCYALQNIQFGFRDEGFLGNVYINCHTSANSVASNPCPAMVTYGGNTYTVTPATNLANSDFELTLPSTTTPGTNSAVWTLVANGAVGSFPAWTEGTLYQSGGAYKVGGTGLLVGCYSESGQAYSWIYGGAIGTDTLGPVVPYTNTPLSLYDGGIQVNIENPAGGLETITVYHGNSQVGARSSGSTIFWGVSGSVSGEFNMELDTTIHALSCVRPSSIGGWFLTSGNAAGPTFGLASPPAGVFAVPGLGLGYNSSNLSYGICLNALPNAPTGGAFNIGPFAVGWFTFASGAAVTGNGLLGWQCTAGGSPGTQLPLYGAQVPVYGALTIAELPSSPPIGTRAVVTNASQTASGNFGATLSSTTGSDEVPVVYTSPGWMIG